VRPARKTDVLASCVFLCKVQCVALQCANFPPNPLAASSRRGSNQAERQISVEDGVKQGNEMSPAEMMEFFLQMQKNSFEQMQMLIANTVVTANSNMAAQIKELASEVVTYG
jgi:hypothetical protein